MGVPDGARKRDHRHHRDDDLPPAGRVSGRDAPARHAVSAPAVSQVHCLQHHGILYPRHKDPALQGSCGLHPAKKRQDHLRGGARLCPGTLREGVRLKGVRGRRRAQAGARRLRFPEIQLRAPRRDREGRAGNGSSDHRQQHGTIDLRRRRRRYDLHQRPGSQPRQAGLLQLQHRYCRRSAHLQKPAAVSDFERRDEGLHEQACNHHLVERSERARLPARPSGALPEDPSRHRDRRLRGHNLLLFVLRADDGKRRRRPSRPSSPKGRKPRLGLLHPPAGHDQRRSHRRRKPDAPAGISQQVAQRHDERRQGVVRYSGVPKVRRKV